jgi:hypothetical protein
VAQRILGTPCVETSLRAQLHADARQRNFDLLEDDARVVLSQPARRLALVEHAPVRPVGYAQVRRQPSQLSLDAHRGGQLGGEQTEGEDTFAHGQRIWSATVQGSFRVSKVSAGGI